MKNDNIGKIVIGDNSNTHNKTDLKTQNQKVQQHPEQKLKDYINYKFNSVSGTTEIVPEPYTSRTCPKCKTVKESSPKGRTFTCTHCNFTFDRDVVGAINIYKKNVSFNQKWLD